jgi:hypothetical protein
MRNILKRPILVFPSGTPCALEYLERAAGNEMEVIGASSLEQDPSRKCYRSWVYLPHIADSGFSDALKKIVADFDIGGIYAAHRVVWDFLNRKLEEIVSGVSLINDSPLDAELYQYRIALKDAQQIIEKPDEFADSSVEAKPAMTRIEMASLLRHSELIPGMCEREKIYALYELSRRASSGDVVEIGSWWGKSAFVLLFLAGHYKIGKMLCVDPWSNEHLIQGDEKGLLDNIRVSAEEALTVFKMNLLPYANGRLNYLRMASVKACDHYQDCRVVQTDIFGKTAYSGEIVILHIDGNHSYSNVLADVAAWSPLVIPGGWIIIDDYCWPYGDGPRKAGDEFLKANEHKNIISFVAGGALFVQVPCR